jgi:DNA modification methylase
MTPHLKDERLTVYCGDNVETLVTIPDDSIDCVVTSPPYGNLRTYGGFTWRFEALADELYRVMAPGGVVCWNVGDEVIKGSETLTPQRQAIYFKDSAGFRVHDTMIYEKSNFGHPEKRRYHQLFEFVYILSKGEPKTFNPIKDKPNAWAGTGPFGVSTMRQRDGGQKEKRRNIISEFGMRSNVWRCKTAGQENPCESIDHPAVMPHGLCSDLVLSWSNPGAEVVVDDAKIKAARSVGFEEGKKSASESLKWEFDREKAEHDRLKKALEEFERASGIQINRWAGGNMSDHVKRALRSNLSDFRKQLDQLRHQTRNILDGMNQAMNESRCGEICDWII